jgi:hypothetical protein
MIRRMFIIAATCAVAAALAAGVGATGFSDPFAGVWVGQEAAPPTGDGSTDYMAIGRPSSNGTRTFLYAETWATFCGGGPFFASGTGISESKVLNATITAFRCANGSPGAIPPPLQISMTATGDGRIDWGGGLLFSRVLRSN